MKFKYIYKLCQIRSVIYNILWGKGSDIKLDIHRKLIGSFDAYIF